MFRRLIVMVFFGSIVLAGLALALRVRVYSSGYWIQTSPPGVVYAFNIWGDQALRCLWCESGQTELNMYGAQNIFHLILAFAAQIT